jgi:hypothetical protein
MNETKTVEGTNNSDALSRYEIIREKVFKELEIKHVQQTVANKLLNKKNKEIELIFYKNEEQVDFSEEDESDETVIFDEKSSTNEEIYEEESSIMNVKERIGENTAQRKLLTEDYLNLEAECSKDEEDDEETGSLEDIIDNSCGDEIELEKYNSEIHKINESMLKNLENKFLKRPNVRKNTAKIENDIFLSSTEDFPEIKIFEFKDEILHEETILIKKENKNDKIKNIKSDFVNKNDQLFNDECKAFEKLSKKEEKKQMGFINNNDL